MSLTETKRIKSDILIAVVENHYMLNATELPSLNFTAEHKECILLHYGYPGNAWQMWYSLGKQGCEKDWTSPAFSTVKFVVIAVNFNEIEKG